MRRILNTIASWSRQNNAYFLLGNGLYKLAVIAAGIGSAMTRDDHDASSRATILVQLTYIRMAVLLPNALEETGRSLLAIKARCPDERKQIQSPANQDELNTPFVDRSEAKPMLNNTREGGTAWLRLVATQGNLTVDLVFWGLIHKLNPNAPGVTFTNHTVSLTTLVYILTNTPILTGKVYKDFLTPILLLYGYAATLITYQKGFDGDSPYAPSVDLNSEDPTVSWVEILALPVLMPLVNGALIKAAEWVQAKWHGDQANPKVYDSRVFPTFSVCCGTLFNALTKPCRRTQEPALTVDSSQATL
jgi:hypothetical protein